MLRAGTPGFIGYRGVSDFYDPAIPAFSLLKSVSRRREEKERLRRDAAPGNAGLQSGMCHVLSVPSVFSVRNLHFSFKDMPN